MSVLALSLLIAIQTYLPSRLDQLRVTDTEPAKTTVPIISERAFLDSAQSQPMKEWLDSLWINQPRFSQGTKWKVLVLIYPNLGTYYRDAAGARTYHTANADTQLTSTLKQNIEELPDLVRRISGGAGEIQVDIHVVSRPITLNDNGNGSQRATFPAPSNGDMKPELDTFGWPSKYDSLAVFFNSGQLPQDLAGAGGGGRNGTSFVGNFGDLGRWQKAPGKPMSWGQGLFLHEWTHGLDGFYRHFGYQIKDLHHLYRYANFDLSDRDLFIAHHQGLLTYLDSSRHGFSRSVWLSGSPRHQAPLLPCQLLGPSPGVTLSAKQVLLRWAPTMAPDGYLVTIKSTSSPDAPPILLSTKANVLQVPDGVLVPGNYKWYVQSTKGTNKSETGDEFRFTIGAAESLAPPTAHAIAVSQQVVTGDGAMIRFWARLSSLAGIRLTYVEYRQPDGSQERVRLQRRSGWAADNRWSGVIRVKPNENRQAESLTLTLYAEDNAGKSIQSQPIPVRVSPQIQKGVPSASWEIKEDPVGAVTDGITPSRSNHQLIPRFTWWPHKGTEEFIQLSFPSAQKIDSCSVYWWQDRGGCRPPESWTLLYREHAEDRWRPVHVHGAYPSDADAWCSVSFEPIKAKELRIQAKLRPGYSAGILEWQVLNSSGGQSSIQKPAQGISAIPARFLVVPQNYQHNRNETYAPFSNFDILQVHVYEEGGTNGDAPKYDGRTWAIVTWPDGSVNHIGFEDVSMEDGGYVTSHAGYYAVATAWIPRLNSSFLDYRVRIVCQQADGTISESPELHRVFVPEFITPNPAHNLTTSFGLPGDPVSAACDLILPPNSGQQGMPRFTWYPHMGTQEWIQINYDRPQKRRSCYVYWFQDNRGCKVPQNWKLMYREDNASSWKPVRAWGGYEKAVDQWNQIRFDEVNAKQFRLEATMQPGFSAGIMEWRLF